MARESIERGRGEDLNIVTKQARQREEQLNNFISNQEEKHCKLTHLETQKKFTI